MYKRVAVKICEQQCERYMLIVSTIFSSQHVPCAYSKALFLFGEIHWGIILSWQATVVFFMAKVDILWLPQKGHED